MSDVSIVEQITAAMELMKMELKTSIECLTKELVEYKKENAVIKEELMNLKIDRERDHKQMLYLENQLKRNNLIFRGITTETDIENAVKNVCANNLKIVAPMAIRSTRKLFDRNGKMAVLAEFENGTYINEIFQHTKNLAGSSISIEKDLNSDRQEQKKAMLYLKKTIWNADQSFRISVRDDKMRIGEKGFAWNNNKELVCGNLNGTDVIQSLYGGKMNFINFDYKVILSKVNKKN